MKKVSFAWLLILFLPVLVAAHEERPRTQSRFADLDGVKVHYNSVGIGVKALVFVHGWICDATFWSQSTNEFPEYRVIAIDLPGHGQSDKPHREYTIDFLASSIEVVMSDAKIEKAVLVGHSVGTQVIQRFYERYPNKSLGMVMVDGLPRALTMKEAEQALEPLLSNYRENVPKFLDDEMLHSIRDGKLKEKIRAAMLATPDYVGRSVVAALAREAVVEEEHPTSEVINIPMLAILADHANWTFDVETFLRSVCPDVDLRLWGGVSHFLMMEQPAAFNESIREFVSKKNLL